MRVVERQRRTNGLERESGVLVTSYVSHEILEYLGFTVLMLGQMTMAL